jgi:hypothetical protein
MAVKPKLIRRVSKTFDRIRAMDLNVDPDVQRLSDPNQLAKLETDWDKMFLGTLVVSRRSDGTMWVIDGQHRKEVARRKEGENFLLDCEVYTGLTRQQEALMFIKLNKYRKAVRPYDSFRISLAAALPTEIAMDAAVRARNMEIAASPSANKVGAVEACRRIVVKGGSALLTDTLEVAEAAWGREAESWDNMMIQAIATVIHKNSSNIEHKRLSNILGRRTVGQWKAAAIATAVGGGGSESRSNKVVELIVVNYNSGLRKAEKNIKL